MGLFAKVKDILFEEEEVNEPVKTVKEEPKEVIKKKEETPVSRQIQPEKKVETEVGTRTKPAVDNFESERDLFRSENTFPFPDFDEEEFNNSVSRPKPKTTNVLEYERKKKTEKRSDYGRGQTTETREVVEKKKFKPSPIISPVYGILNEDYKIEDIKEKKSNNNDLDLDIVRKKAFEPEEKKVQEKRATYYEEPMTVNPVEPEEAKNEKVKTIDELLEDTSDVTIDVDSDKKTRTKPKEEYDKLDSELEDIINEPVEKKDDHDEDDTLENDLFDLIDSMYEKREDGDY